jgi:hypothetical protein
MLTLLVTLVVLGIILWAITQIPMDPTVRQIIRVVAIVLALFYVLQAFGLLASMPRVAR